MGAHIDYTTAKGKIAAELPVSLDGAVGVTYELARSVITETDSFPEAAALSRWMIG